MSQLRRVHLFNCDRTYKFDTVEDLLTKAKVSFDTVEKHPFSLGQMPEMTTKIPSLGIDLAFFVVHAHESRLSINEDNAGIGYAKIYRALLNATGGNVIIVIGGDDNYRNGDEEDQVVISRWAKRKVSSQFKEEFLDGRKSFIFSWNKKHRPIHEEALRHFFDPNKKGQKFEYQPPKRKLPPEPQTPPVEKVTDKRPQQPSWDSTQHDLAYQQKTRENYQPYSDTRGNFKPKQNDAINRQMSGDVYQPSSYTKGKLSDPLQSDAEHPKKGEDQMNPHLPHTSATRDKADIYHTRLRTLSDPLQSDAERLKKGEDQMRPHVPHISATKDKLDSYSGHAETYPSSSSQNPQKVLAVIGYHASYDSMKAVEQVFKNLPPELNIPSDPPTVNLSPTSVNDYLMANPLQFCVLVLDAKIVKDAYSNLRTQIEYENVLQTAAENVGEKVIVAICGKVSMSPEEEDLGIVFRAIDSILQDKGFPVWLRDGKLTVLTDVLILALASLIPKPIPSSSYDQSSLGSQMISMQVEAPKETLMVKTLLRHGQISEHADDVIVWEPDSWKVPIEMQQDLLRDYKKNPIMVLEIIRNEKGRLVTRVNKCKGNQQTEWQPFLQPNETIMLETRVFNGRISFDPEDVKYYYPNWKIPDSVIAGVQKEHRMTSNGQLWLISDEKGFIRSIVRVGTIRGGFRLINQAIGYPVI